MSDDRLPTHDQLSHLAACLPSLSGEREGYAVGTRVEAALAIWKQARVTLSRARRELDEDDLDLARMTNLDKEEKRRLQLLLGPLKLGSSSLPATISVRNKDEPIPFDDFLAKVVGGKRIEERMKWWRAFTTAWLLENEVVRLSREACKRNPETEPILDLRDIPGWIPPAEFGEIKITDDLLSAELAYRQAEGFGPTSAFFMARNYRQWRVGMKTSEEPRQSFPDLEECRNLAIKKNMDSQPNPQIIFVE